MKRKALLLAVLVALMGLLVAACAPTPGAVVADAERPAAALSDEDDQGEDMADDADMAGDKEDDDGEAEDAQMDDEDGEATPDLQLATASVASQLSNQPGRAIVAARGNHFIVDSVPPLDGPNEERNPLDLMLGALATCGTFLYEAAAQEMAIPLDSVAATVEADFDPRGLTDASINPRIRAFRVYMDVSGPSAEEAAALAEAFRVRCPVYTTLSRSAPIEISHDEMPEGPIEEGLATASVVSRLSNQPGRAIVSARGNHFVVDSVPPIDGPNEERNPLDLLLGALATCGTFIYESSAQGMDIPLDNLIATVEGDLDPRGVAGADVNPRLRAFRVQMSVAGPDGEDAEALADAFRTHCPVYTTLERSAPIEITTDRE